MDVPTQADPARLSEHFTLPEMTVTAHTEIDNTPTPEDAARLRMVCADGLEVVRAHFGRPIVVHSGYRSPALNAAIPGSAKNSAHSYGCAADFHVEGVGITETVRWIAFESGIPFDQVIDEMKGAGRWVHLGFTRPGRPGPRREVLVMRDGKYSVLGRSAP
jgi:zinc D-Ala-D-Ala carboxypeptidase